MALEQLQKAEEIYSKYKDTFNLKSVYKNYGLCHLHVAAYSESKLYYTKAIQLEEKLKDTLGLSTSYMDLASLYYVQYKDKEAIPLFEKGLHFANKSGDVDVMSTANLNMAIVEENRGRLEAALAYRKTYEKLLKRIWSRDRIWELAQKEKEFEVAQKEQEILVLAQEKKIKEQQRTTFLILLIVVSVFLTYVFVVYKKGKRHNKIVMTQREELSKINKMKDRLFSIIAHDLRSPVHALQSINKKASIALKNKKDTTLQKAIYDTEKNLHQIYLLLDNTLHWALHELQQLLFNTQLNNIKALLISVGESYQGVCEAKNIQMTYEISSDIYLEVDSGTLKIALRNLLDNAVKFSKVNGTIMVSARTTKKHCIVEIEDNGIGMHQEFISEMFTVGKKEKGRNAKNDGVGLGLSLVKAFIEKNKGILSVKSKLHHGTIFSIQFPLTS